MRYLTNLRQYYLYYLTENQAGGLEEVERRALRNFNIRARLFRRDTFGTMKKIVKRARIRHGTKANGVPVTKCCLSNCDTF